MDLWKELNDFSAYEKRIPCVLCSKESEKTIVGDHWKCGVCDHLFNSDGSSLRESIECHCDVCHPKKDSTMLPTAKKLDLKVNVKKIIKKLTSGKKKKLSKFCQ